MKKKTLALAMLLLLAFTGCQKDTAGEKEKQTEFMTSATSATGAAFMMN